MSRPSIISHLGIRLRVLILALVPITLITLVLSGYMISSRLNLERETLLQNSQTLLGYLAAGAEFGLFSENAEALSGLAKAPQEQDDIVDIIFINAEREEVYRAGNVPIGRLPLIPPHTRPASDTPLQFGELWAFQAPVMVSGINVDDFGDESQLDFDQGHLGWVILLVSDKAMEARQQEILVRGLIITLIGLSVTLWMALSIGRSITNPIQAIIETIERLRHEQLDARVRVQNRGEIGELEQGINSLAARVQRTRRRLEEDVIDATQSLRDTLHTLERKNIALDQEKQRAERANQAKDEFLARMSHELRTPLTSVMGFIQLLQKTKLDPEQSEYSSIVRRTSSLLLRLIDDILDFSKLQSDAIKIEQIPFSLEECIEDILEMQAPIADSKGIELHFICDPNLPDRIAGDPTRMRQVISNLIGNAVKFTHEGEVVVEMRVRWESTDNSLVATGTDSEAPSEEPMAGQIQVNLSIRDTGVGIDAHKQQTLFQPFSQADTSITRRFGGSGLGLVITKRLVELMGGRIRLQSQPGQGTEVRLQLNFASCRQPEQKVNLAKMRVLLFDRNDRALNAVNNCLKKWKAHTRVTRNQKDLLQALGRSPTGNHSTSDSARFDSPTIDCVVLGVPDLKGGPLYQTQLLRSVRRRFTGKIVLVTGHSSILDTDLQYLQNDGLQRFNLEPIYAIQRPLTHRKLLNALKRDKAPQDRSTATPNRSVSASLSGIRLLVAEDNDFNRLLLQKIFEQAGADATLVSNGEQALAQASQQSFDCILMDVHMPMMDGIEASHRIRQLPSPLNRVPIIALTANVIANEEQALKEAGVVTTLFKPVNEQAIISHIRLATEIDGNNVVAVPGENKTRLSDFGISVGDLQKELDHQTRALFNAMDRRDIMTMRDHAHQLTGLAGLLDLVELEAVTMAFSHALKNQGWRDIWQQLWRLKRVIDGIEV